jgi:hypothetical protein
VIYAETIAYALQHPEGVRYETTILNLNRDREELHKAARKMTDKPITVFTRTHEEYPYDPYLLVKQFDPTTITEFVDGRGNLSGPRI